MQTQYNKGFSSLYVANSDSATYAEREVSYTLYRTPCPLTRLLPMILPVHHRQLSKTKGTLRLVLALTLALALSFALALALTRAIRAMTSTRTTR